MRTIQRVALVFGLVNLLFGIVGFISPLVKPTRRSMLLRLFKRNNPSWLNTQPGEEFGLFGTNWVHSLAHIALGLPALIPTVRNRFGQAYLGVLSAVFASLAGLGFLQFGTKTGVHDVMGMALNREDNYLHSAMAGMGLMFALMPVMRQLPSALPQVREQAQQVVGKVTSKVQKEPTEKMPV